MSSINLYPQIDDVLLETVHINTKRSYHYKGLDGCDYSLDEVYVKGFEDKQIYELNDENSEYDQCNDTLYLDIEFSIKNGKYLFGKYGLVYDDAVLGIGLEWKSKKSKIRHCTHIGQFDKLNSFKELVFKVNNIELTELNSDTVFNWIIYVKRKGTEIPGLFYANKEGLIIGRRYILTIKGEGEGSLFPIREYGNKFEPLWKINVLTDDPYLDSFTSDNLCIMVNKYHKDYQFIQYNHRNFNPSFLMEVLATALFMLIKEVSSKIDDFKNMKSKYYENGSIVQALLYFEQELNIKIHGSDIELMYSIKSFMDKNTIKQEVKNEF